MMSETQNKINLQGITKLKNKLGKLKESLSAKNIQCIEYENEVQRINQILDSKETEISTLLSQYQQQKIAFDNDMRQKDALFLEKIKSKLV